MKKRIIISMILFLIHVFALSLVTDVRAQVEDITPPSLIAFSFTPDIVDVSSEPQTITITSQITDDITGFSTGTIFFRSPSGQHYVTAGVGGRISGDALDGIYQTAMVVPQFIENGVYHLDHIELYDGLHNYGHPDEQELIAMGFPTTFTVTSTQVEDITPPSLIAFSFTPDIVDVSSEPQTITITSQITDDITGFSTGTIFFRSPSGQHYVTAGVGGRISGDALDGIYQTAMVVPQFIENGVYHLDHIELYDGLHNYGHPDEQELIAMGFPTTFTVTSTQVEDITPPSLIAFSFTPDIVDVSSEPQTITITSQITDDITGFSTGTIFFRSPSGQHYVTAGVGGRISGDALDGIYQTAMVVPQFIENGVYHLDHIELYDGLHNYGHPDEQELIAMGFPTELEVVSTSDTTPPVLEDFSFSPTMVDVTTGAATVTATSNVTDDIAGFLSKDISLVFDSPSGLQSEGTSQSTRISGNEYDGVYQSEITIQQFAEEGTWVIRSVSLHDAVGNGVTYSPDQLETLGFPTELEVVSTSDTTPPVLEDFSFSPTMVDVTTGAATVTATSNVTDDIAGFLSKDISLVFDSPSGLQSEGTSQSTRISGNEYDGVYQSEITIQQFAEEGTWVIRSVSLHDAVGNGVTYSPDQLETLGFPTELEVVSTSDTTPPVLEDFSFSPTMVDVTTGAATVTATSNVTDDIAGFLSKDISLVFDSPSGLQSEGTSQSTRISGNEYDGVYQSEITIQQFAEEGTWVIRSVSLHDAVGNGVTYSPDQLETLGFPTELEVVYGPADTDGDGVPDDQDECPYTVIPESVPTKRLGTNRFALVDRDEIFDTKSPKGKGPHESFTIEDTAGCSCEQIIEEMGLGKGHEKFGCSLGVMRDLVDSVNP